MMQAREIWTHISSILKLPYRLSVKMRNMLSYDIYLEYGSGSFQLVKKFMRKEEIDRFERVREEAVLISRFVTNEYENSIWEDDRGRE